jgi:uncharacterized protein YndB with AHSA1/START domain
MPHPFKVEKEIELQATPEQIWEAIATGKGIDGWFLGTGNEIEPREGGTAHMTYGEEAADSTITTWDPPRRFATRGEPAPDGSLHAFEYTVEGRGGTTVVRLVHSGFLAGEDWEKEYEALGEGDFMYLHLMAQYVTYFRGRPATTISIWRPDSAGREAALAGFREALGLRGEARERERVRFNVEGLEPIEGEVDFVSRSIIGVRTSDGLYRFLYSPQGIVFLGHHIYGDVDKQRTQRAWEAWLERTFASTPV